MAAKLLLSDRKSNYEAGLDDDGFFDDFLSFPEKGSADQQSAELQLTGDFGAWDYVAGLYWFEEEGYNLQDPTIFLGGPGDFLLAQKVDSQAIYANVGYNFSEDLRVSAGLRYTQDDKNAGIIINQDADFPDGLINETSSRDWSEVSWDISGNYQLNDRLNVYGTIQSGYQSGQFPAAARSACSAQSSGCSLRSPATAARGQWFRGQRQCYRLELRGGTEGPAVRQPADEHRRVLHGLLRPAVPGQHDDTRRRVQYGEHHRRPDFDGHRMGEHLAGARKLPALHDPRLHRRRRGRPEPPTAVAPLTPELTFSISPELSLPLGEGNLTLRADYSFRDDMFGEPSSDPVRFTQIDSRDLINVDVTYEPADGDWSLSLYGKNITDERYDNARLNVTDYVLVIMSNDASEWGVRLTRDF